MNHFLEISQLSRNQIETILDRARSFQFTHKLPSYPKYSVANLFYEDSTRTRISFELAAKQLSMPVINVDLQRSSENKGEIIEDTVQTLVAMGISTLVIRHKEEGIQQRIADQLGDAAHLINAGDGTHAHPSQAILDMLTIVEQKPRLDALKIAILGNIKHSRVANSFQVICEKLGVGELVLVAPKVWQPQTLHFGHVTDDLKTGLEGADVVICLRVQRERLAEADHLDLATYRKAFALTASNLRLAKPDAMVMHPGPVNRGVEIDSDVVDGSQSFILQQVQNGVFARMAILESLIQPKTPVLSGFV